VCQSQEKTQQKDIPDKSLITAKFLPKIDL